LAPAIHSAYSLRLVNDKPSNAARAAKRRVIDQAFDAEALPAAERVEHVVRYRDVRAAAARLFELPGKLA
jgi:hypothetical protein